MKDCFFREGKMYENIGGIDIEYPPMPEKEQILFHNLPQKDQKWRPTQLPDCFDEIEYDDNLNPVWTKEQNLFRLQEKKRFEEGIWFYNNGLPTYITGRYYFELCYWKIDIGLKQYRDRDRRVHMHLDYCFDNPDCYGQIYMKHRRDGATWRALSVMYIDTILKKDIFSGIQSKTDEDGRKTFKKMIFAWRKLEQFLRPAHDGTDNPETVLKFVQPSRKKGAKVKKRGDDGSLNSEIDYKSSKSTSYDGQKLYRYYMDEAGKTEAPVDVYRTWDIVRPCLELGSSIVGKAMITSTVEAMESGGANFKRIWEESDPFDEQVERNNGRTISGLYKLFIPAYDGLEDFIDEYGYSIIEPATEEQITFLTEKAKKEGKKQKEIDSLISKVRKGAYGYLDSKRKALISKNLMEKLSDEKRKYPFTEQEALMATSDGCHFDLHKLETRAMELADFERNKMPLEAIGEFFWENDVQGSKVIFRHTPNGKWRVSWLPKQDNLVRKSGGNTYPMGNDIFKMGCDPLDKDKVIDPTRASKFAFHVFKEYNAMDEGAYWNENFIVEYLHRGSIVEINYEDLLMTCHFFGAKVLVESQRGEDLFKYFVKRGYDDFIMRRPESTVTPGSGGTEHKGIPMSVPVKRQLVNKTRTFIYNNCEKMRHLRTVNDWKAFDVDNMSPYDLSVSAGLTLISREEFVENEAKEQVGADFIDVFDISGVRSELITNG